MANLDDNYEVPNSSNGYMRLEKGENRFRVLDSKIIVGTEYWVEVKENGASKRKPKRVAPEVQIPLDEVATNEFNGNLSISPFWAMVVWNYEASKVQILTITQKTIMSTLMKYKKDADWGDFTGYDLVVTKEKGEMTNYVVTAKPHRAISEGIKEALSKSTINLEALYVSKEFPFGGNPFQAVSQDVDLSDEEIEKISASAEKNKREVEATF